MNTDWNTIYRRVPKKPQFIKAGNKISSALFKDSKGVSVDRDGGRTQEEIIQSEEKMHNKINSEKENAVSLQGIVYLTVDDCMQASVLVKDDPIEGNEYHSIIIRDENIIPLTGSQAKKLANSAKVLKWYL